MFVSALILLSSVIRSIEVSAQCVAGSTGPPQTGLMQKIQSAANAWVYGLPAYAIQMTRNSYLEAGIPLNFVQAAPGLQTAAGQTVVRPNADTIYSIAFFDLSQGPVSLNLPNVTDRYFVAAMYDAYSNNFASPGTFQGSPPGNYTLYGPQDAGCAGTTGYSIVSQTNDVWMIARFYVKNATVGSTDLALIKLLQSQLYVSNSPSTISSTMPSFGGFTNLAIRAYYGLNQAVSDNPYQAGPYNYNYSRIGLAIGRSFRPTLSAANLTVAQTMGNASITASVLSPGALRPLGNGWALPNTVGAYGDNYLARAYIANTGLGALTPDQAIYPTYIGSQPTSAFGLRYSIFFPSGPPPFRPNGFWSLTLYDANGFLVSNTLNRYSLGSRDNITRSANGSFTLIASSQAPPAAQLNNWLPAPAGQGWTPTLRVYGASEAVRTGQGQYPILTAMAA